jgi:hypothetical protein
MKIPNHLIVDLDLVLQMVPFSPYPAPTLTRPLKFDSHHSGFFFKHLLSLPMLKVWFPR